MRFVTATLTRTTLTSNTHPILPIGQFARTPDARPPIEVESASSRRAHCIVTGGTGADPPASPGMPAYHKGGASTVFCQCGRCRKFPRKRKPHGKRHIALSSSPRTSHLTLERERKPAFANRAWRPSARPPTPVLWRAPPGCLLPSAPTPTRTRVRAYVRAREGPLLPFCCKGREAQARWALLPLSSSSSSSASPSPLPYKLRVHSGCMHGLRLRR